VPAASRPASTTTAVSAPRLGQEPASQDDLGGKRLRTPITIVFDVEPLLVSWDCGQESLDLGIAAMR
jgi:hypothetical protein